MIVLCDFKFLFESQLLKSRKTWIFLSRNLAPNFIVPNNHYNFLHSFHHVIYCFHVRRKETKVPSHFFEASLPKSNSKLQFL